MPGEDTGKHPGHVLPSPDDDISSRGPGFRHGARNLENRTSGVLGSTRIDASTPIDPSNDDGNGRDPNSGGSNPFRRRIDGLTPSDSDSGGGGRPNTGSPFRGTLNNGVINSN